MAKILLFPYSLSTIQDIYMLTRNETIFKWTMLILMGIGAIYQFRYRFNHPDMSETQLFLHFFDAFKE
jgi:hypothetical protein